MAECNPLRCSLGLKRLRKIARLKMSKVMSGICRWTLRKEKEGHRYLSMAEDDGRRAYVW